MLELTKLKSAALAAVEESAKSGDAGRVVKAAEGLRELQSLEEQLDTICRKLQRLARTDSRDGERKDVSQNPQSSTNVSIHPVLSARRKGDERRALFVEGLRADGIDLVRIKGVIYEATGTGMRVGIASASCNEKDPTRWFLGLPGGEFDHAILLCEDEDSHILGFSLDPEFLGEQTEVLSRDARGQVKFNVVRSGSSYFLSVPGRGGINIDRTRDNYGSLRG